MMDEVVYDNYALDPEVDAVIYGLDYELTYQKICIASLYLQEKKVPLIASNYDKVAMINGRYTPGSGSILQPLLTATGLKLGSHVRSTSLEEPGTFDLIGKPNPFSIELIKEEHGISMESRTLMIGDNPSTDILYGKNAGVDQCMVLSGIVRSLKEFERDWLPQNPDYRPTWVMNMVGDLQA